MVAASGGVTALKRHYSLEIHASKTYENQGIAADLAIRARTPSQHEEVEEWRAKDPVKRAFAYLLSAGVAEEELEAIRAALADEIEKAIAQAESEPDPRPEDAARHVYAADNPLPDGTRA